MSKPYKLRCNLAGHEKDVRALVPSIFPEHGLISGSRDNTTALWIEDKENNCYIKETSMRGHSNFVSCVCVMPPDDAHPEGLIVTGSNDKTILAYTPGVPEPVFKLTGHTGNVCALASGKFGFLLSGSWDTTARVWLNEKCVMTLEGHEMAVWAVGIISGQGVMLTGSADKTIKAWKAGKCTQTFKGHEDCVRGLGVVSEAEFLSCSNDATVRRWAVTSGDCLGIYYGHTNYVYSLSILPNGEDFVTGGEDRTLRIWKEGKNIQTLYHPSESVWAVCAMPNGDIATGSSDGMIRVFTQEPDKFASAEVLAAHEAALATAPVSSQPLGDIKTEDLAGPESLNKPGKKDGQTTMINRDGKVEVYNWDASQAKWMMIGNVVGSSGGTQKSSGKTLFEGKEYDYVFSVDIKEGAPPLKLPFNISEDPWMAAQKFLNKNNLSQLFLDQVANFIVENTKGVTLGTGSALAYSDPFTGGDRYVPEQEKMDTSDSAASDPFTGSGRYIPSGQEKTVSGNHFPLKKCLFFDTASPIEQILGKMKDFNQSVEKDQQVTEAALEELSSLLEGSIRGDNVKTLHHLIKWPQEVVFPALDILRMAIKGHEVCQFFCKQPDFIDLLCQHASQGNSNACRMLSLRTLNNLFRYPEGTEANQKNIDSILQAAINSRDIGTKNGQIAAATLILNFCVKLFEVDDLESKAKCLQAAGEVLGSDIDTEAKYRLMVAVGTLITNDDCSKALALSIDLPNIISKLNTSEPGRLAECSSMVSNILKS